MMLNNNFKKVLLISYSQTGQLSELAHSIISPLETNENMQVVHKVIRPVQSYPFPWNFIDFMNTFPESALLVPCDIEDIEEDEEEFDLVILAYQVWFLSPSIPITAFMKSDYAKKTLKGKPVITLIGCRNMWIMAQEKMKQMLKDVEATLIDNIVVIDQGSSLATFITTPRWMMTGKKNGFWGIFPEAGIAKEEITNASRFGHAIVDGLMQDEEKKKESLCHGLGAVNVDIKLIKSEKIATKSFTIWGKIIRAIGGPENVWRKPVVMLYVVFLVLIILTVVPINMLVQSINRKINKENVLQEKTMYEQPSGSDTDRMKDFI